MVILRRAYTKARALFIGLVVLCIVAYAGFNGEWFQKKFVYPYPYQELVSEYADLYNVDSALVAGVILGESKFELSAKSHKGATGLMQLMPDTAKWIAEQLDDTQFSVEELRDPEINIRYGTWYLSSLQKEFKGNEILMLAAYNAGRGNVKHWMQQYEWTMDFSDASQIPFKETREYVIKVLRYRDGYYRLYGN